ncbi:MAG: hypothetical protein AMJ75_02295 [Phycisphaerae bacterium SM1_79]|nr:MAG: hypothetical protein AMJ75_02295 [Phycisphaerae bacterium SM1_79]
MAKGYAAQSHRFVAGTMRRLSCSANIFTPDDHCYARTKHRPDDLASYDSFMEYDNDRHQYLTIYASEFRAIAGLSAIWAEYGLETGGDIYALVTDGGRIVILLVTGPGPKATHESAFFKQDIVFFRRTNGLIATRLGIQWKGTHHCHHFLGISGPSGTDVVQVQGVTRRNNFKRWCEIITTCENSHYSSQLFGRSHRDMPRPRSSLLIRVRAFLYTDPQRGEKVEVPLRVLPGISPYRMRILADGALDPVDVGEYACDFPMDQIIYESFDFERQYSNPAEKIPQKLVQECAELPESIQNSIDFYVKPGGVTVTFLLPDDSFALITYDDQPPYSIQTVRRKRAHAGDAEDLTEALISGKMDVTLNQICEMLMLNNRMNATANTCLVRREQIPESIAEQIHGLPEHIQSKVSFSINQGLMTVTLPLPDSLTASVGYINKPPHMIQSVDIKSNDSEDTENVVMSLTVHNGSVTLRKVYEMLAIQISKGKNDNAD